MKGFIVLTLAMLASIAPLYAQDSVIIRRAKDKPAQVAPQGQPTGQQEEQDQGPTPLTEEEQIALIKGMNLPDMESNDEAAPEVAD